jgi:DNA primase
LPAYEELQKAARSAMDFAGRAVLPGGKTATPEQKARAAQALFEIVLNAESETARMGFIQENAAYLNVSAHALARDFELFRQRDRRGQTAAAAGGDPSSASPPSQRIPPEHDLLLICLHFEELGKPLSHALPHDWIDASHAAGALLNRFLAEFEQDAWPGRLNLDPLLETDEEKSLIASLLFATPSMEDPRKVALEGLQQIRTRALEPRLRQIELALANHRADSTVDAFSLLKERSELQRQLRQPLMLPDPV